MEQASREQQIMLPEQSVWLLQPVEQTAGRTKSPGNLVHSEIINKLLWHSIGELHCTNTL